MTKLLRRPFPVGPVAAIALVVALGPSPATTAEPPPGLREPDFAGTWRATLNAPDLPAAVRLVLNRAGGVHGSQTAHEDGRTFHLDLTGTWRQVGNDLELALKSGDGERWQLRFEVLGSDVEHLILRERGRSGEVVRWRRILGPTARP